MDNRKSILVIGSSNVDLIARVSHLPIPGETVGDAEYCVAYGGKGANQAVAAARAGGHVTFVSCLGDDSYADALMASFHNVGIDVSNVRRCSNVSTGVAFIFVDDGGENCIAVAPGANALLGDQELYCVLPLVAQADVLLLQLEIPIKTVLGLIEKAYSVNTKVVLNLAPAQFIPWDTLRKVDVLILNETEADMLLEHPSKGMTALERAHALCSRGIQSVILTLGIAGAAVASVGIEALVPSWPVATVDTTGAGDTFCGAFVARWMENGGNLLEAVRFATASAALSVTKLGAQTSIPRLEDVELFIQERCKNK